MDKTHYFQEQESKYIEFKSRLPAFSSLIKTCVAFANGIGGKLIIGVEDKTGKVIGISDQDREKVYEQFLDSLYDLTQPSILARIYEKSFGDSSVLIIDISPSSKKPCYVKSEGIPKGVYLRVGSHTRRAKDEHIEELMRETRRITYDEEPIYDSKIELSRSLLQSVYGNYVHRQLLADQVLKVSAVNGEQLFPTVAGVLFFSEEPEKYIHEATVMCTEFQGTKGRDIIATREITGSIPHQVDQTLSLISEWMTRNFELKGARLFGKLPIPKQAIREALINAVIHRKYTVKAPVKVSIWRDRLEIFSPGDFPGLVDIAHLGDGTTCLRNPHLAKLARKCKLVEKLGTGIRLIFDSCQKAGLPPPEFKEDGDFVKVILYYPLHLVSGVDDESIILQLLRSRKTILIGDVMNVLEVSRNTATRKLTKLVEKGLLQRRGSGPSVHYVSK